MGRRRDLTARDILPGVEDISSLRKRFSARIKTVLSTRFTAFSSHKKPPPKRKTVTASTYRPLELMGANEATTADNITILRQFATEAGMSADNCWAFSGHQRAPAGTFCLFSDDILRTVRETYPSGDDVAWVLTNQANRLTREVGVDDMFGTRTRSRPPPGSFLVKVPS
uniref:Uncharacterized protein n=1 Tax=Branchiostoma floridae TaxID=7739 RepID=C3Y854_BRAFL|eukprot:XP_002607513.1 hypothetical protein BRAFLDRAFT_69944 [Branchiostoma floridae]